VIPKGLQREFNLDRVPFISNAQLRNTLAQTSATPEHVDEAVRINAEVRLVALKVSIFALAGLALLAFFPAGGLPGYIRGEVPGSRTQSPGHAGKQPVAVIDR
jgi:hypothetical protein